MAVPTWSQLPFLTAPQQTTGAALAVKGQEFAVWKQAKGPKPDMSGFTAGQLKAADAMLRDLGTLIGPARLAIQFGLEEKEAAAVAAWKAANP